MSIWNVVMLQHKMILCLFILFLLQGCQKQENEMNPPVANIKSHSFEIQGTIINDEYAWLRDNNWPEVKDRQIISYLEEENKFFDQFFLPLKNDKEKIFEEIFLFLFLKRQCHIFFTTSFFNESNPSEFLLIYKLKFKIFFRFLRKLEPNWTAIFVMEYSVAYCSYNKKVWEESLESM